MNKFWYVVQEETGKKKGEYLIGFIYGREDVEEEELIKYVEEYCKEKKFRLVLLFQMAPLLMIVNQVYPFEVTEESSMCMEYAMQAIMNGQNVIQL
jgi:ribosomal protein L7Ae-like RNA K-turn-binding protein